MHKILLLASLLTLLGCRGEDAVNLYQHETYRKVKRIENPETVHSVDSLLALTNDLVVRLFKVRLDMLNGFIDLDTSFSTTGDQLKEDITAYYDEYTATVDSLVDYRLQLRQIMTKDEWETLFGKEKTK